MILLLSACQGANPAGPTAIPSDTATLAASLTPAGSNTPEPSLVPIVTATGLGPTSAPTIAAPTPVPTQGPRCLSAGKGDTLYTIAYKAGYNDPNILPLIRQLNNMCPGCNDIQVGQKICVPLPTATPTPPGFELTATKQAQELPTSVAQAGAPAAIATYVVVSGDTLTVLEFSLHASLRQLCALNNPDPINCAGCNLDAPLGQPGCKPVIKLGAVIRYPGPTPTPSITPTLTGSETMTPTPLYPGPRIVSPSMGSSEAGLVQLVWLPSGILQPDELYLVLVTDATAGHTWEFESEDTSFRLPASLIPTDAQVHTINWQVVVAHKAPDGTYVQIGQASLINTFSWQGHAS